MKRLLHGDTMLVIGRGGRIARGVTLAARDAGAHVIVAGRDQDTVAAVYAGELDTSTESDGSIVISPASPSRRSRQGTWARYYPWRRRRLEGRARGVNNHNASGSRFPSWVLGRRIQRAYRDEVGVGEQALLVAWSAFGATFAITRALTYWLHTGHGPVPGGLVLGGRHIHHYNLGIALLEAIGAIALRGRPRRQHDPLTAAAYGIGTALIVDELALLIDLQDVYWAREGRRSVDAAIGLLTAGGIYLAAAPFWHRAARECVRACVDTASGDRSSALAH